MAQILDKQGLQHYANKMCNADNRKVGSKNLPTALNEIDIAIDGFKTLFETEYGTPVNMELENNKNVFSVGTGINIDKKDDVENSFTDVELSGNSLVAIFNLSYTTTNEVTTSYYHIGTYEPNLQLKDDVYYTLLPMNPLEYVYSVALYNKIDGELGIGGLKTSNKPLLFKKNTNITTDILFRIYLHGNNTTIPAKTTFNFLVLEGDWTNKPIPQYFEGLKSVGEKEDGNHKISILSSKTTPNILENSHLEITGDNEYTHIPILHLAQKHLGENITVSADVKIAIDGYIRMYTLGKYETDISRDFNLKKDTWYRISSTGSFKYNPNGNNGEQCNLSFYGTYDTGRKVTVKNVKISLGHNEEQIEWIPHFSEMGTGLNTLYDKKEILLNEPLRGLPNGVKDTIEKVNGEWKIVRRCGEIIFDGSETWGRSANSDLKELTSHFSATNFKSSSSTIICDKYKCVNIPLVDCEEEAVKVSGEFWVNINKSRLSTDTVAGFKEWLSQNNIRVIYKLENYIIEDISPVTLQCWKNGTISIDEVLPVESTHTVALNKSAQIQKNIEELSILRNRIKALEKQYDNSTLNQAYELELLRLDMQLNNII